MTVRMLCPHCRCMCQLPVELLGNAVKCGKCGQVFGTPAPSATGSIYPGMPAAPSPPAAPAPASPPAPQAPPAPSPTSLPAQAASPAPAAEKPAPSGGFWAGVRGLYRSITSPRQSATAPAPGPAPESLAEDEVGVELDGPVAAAPPAAGPTAAPPTAVCRLDLGSATTPGLVRTRNEDSLLVVQLTATNLDRRRDAALIVVADGVGGEDAGDQASALTIRTVGAALLGPLAALPAVHGQDRPPAGLAEQIAAAIRSANQAVYDTAAATPGCKGMAATVAVVVIWEGVALIGHVGDCRVYHLAGGELRQVTRDQTLVARMVEMGKLSPAEALTHPSRNEVLQAVGKRAEIHPAPYEVKLSPGDWLVVACDGLHAHVDAGALAETLGEAQGSAAAAAQRLVDLANEGGGSDNCTVVAARCY